MLSESTLSAHAHHVRLSRPVFLMAFFRAGVEPDTGGAHETWVAVTPVPLGPFAWLSVPLTHGLTEAPWSPGWAGSALRPVSGTRVPSARQVAPDTRLAPTWLFARGWAWLAEGVFGNEQHVGTGRPSLGGRVPCWCHEYAQVRRVEPPKHPVPCQEAARRVGRGHSLW